MLYNNEVRSINDWIECPEFVANSSSKADEFGTGFKVEASDLYRRAGEMLKTEGHEDAATRLNAVSASLLQGLESVKDDCCPASAMESLEWDFSKGSVGLSTVLDNEEYLDRQPVQDVYTKLADLLRIDLNNPPAQPSTSQKPTM